MGRLARRAGEEDVTATSCSAGMVYLLSAEPYISPYYFSGFGEQVIDGGAQPALMAVDADRLQASFE